LVINAVSRILRTGAPQRDLPPEYGKWGTARRRFIRRRDEWIWEKPLEILINEPDFGRLMTDADHRHLAENAFSHLGQWRGIAARYAKAPASLKA